MEHVEELVYSMSVNNLAAMHITMGAYPKAEMLYKQSLRVTASTLGTEHPSYASTSTTWESSTGHSCAFEEAERLFVQSKRFGRGTLAMSIRSLLLLGELGRTPGGLYKKVHRNPEWSVGYSICADVVWSPLRGH